MIHNQEPIPPEVKLLFYTTKTKIDPEIKSKINRLLQNEIDWYYLLKIAYKQGLASLLYYQLNSMCPESVPEPMLNSLKESFNKNLQKNLLLSGELLKILEILKSENINAIPYKGPSLAIAAYENLAFRLFNNLEIFIQEDDVLKCRDLLIANGYKLDEKYDINETLFIIKFDEYQFYKENKQDIKIKIKIRWKIPNLSFTFPTDWDNFLDEPNINNMLISNHEVSSFSFEDLILILSLQIAGNYWKRILWLFDIGEIIRNHEINWKNLLINAGKKGIKRILFINLLLLQDLQGVTIPEELIREIDSDNVAKEISANIKKEILSRMEKDYLNKDHPPHLLKHIFLHIKIREHIKDGIKDAIVYLTKPTLDEINALALPSFLFSLYYVFKPFLLLKDYLIGRFIFRPGEYVPTPHNVVEKMLSIADVGPDDTVYDLGCGDGRIVIIAAKNYGARGVGIDIDPERIKESRISAEKEGLEHLTKFIEQDIKKTDVSEASVVCFYVYSRFLKKYKSKLEKELKPGTRIVSHDFEIEGWVPIKKEHVVHDWVSTIYLWKIS